MEVYSVSGKGRVRLFENREKAVECFREKVKNLWKEYQEFVDEMEEVSEDDIWKYMLLEEYDNDESQVCWSYNENREDDIRWYFCFYDMIDERESEYKIYLRKLTVE